MLKKKAVYVMLIFALIFSFSSATLAADILPEKPVLKLTVTQSPLTVYPPIMIFTAQLSTAPITTGSIPKVDFFHVYTNGTSTIREYLGSATVDVNGIARLSKQIKPGVYNAVAETVVNGQRITSNIVVYKVN